MEIKRYTKELIPDVLRFEQDLRAELKKQGVDTIVGLIGANEDAQRFYRSLPNSLIRDEGIWIDL